MTPQDTELIDIYNLILNPGTRAWEREQLITAKNEIETGNLVSRVVDQLEAKLRPLALRNNLTPDVTDFYLRLTRNSEGVRVFDYARHTMPDLAGQERAIFAGGCFWCMVQPFETLPGIVSVLSGYTSGHTPHPTYDQVVAGGTGHVEAVEIIFDTHVITYQQLIELYWQLTDPTDAMGQFEDRGNEYRPVIFFQNKTQKEIADQSKARLKASGRFHRPIVTTIAPATIFWPAENFHQQFYKKNPKRYRQIARAKHQLIQFQALQNQVWRFVHHLPE